MWSFARACITTSAILLPLQAAAAQQLSVGLRAAASSADLALGEGWESRLGGEVGVVALMPLGGRLVFEPGLMLTRRGAQAAVADATADGATFGKRVDLTYLELPMLVRWQVPLGRLGFVRPVFHAGPVASVLLGCRSVASVAGGGFPAGTSASTPCDASPSFLCGDSLCNWDMGLRFDRSGRVDVGAVVGGGVAMDVGRSLVTIDVRYSHGLLPFDGPWFSGAHNREWTLGFAWTRPW